MIKELIIYCMFLHAVIIYFAVLLIRTKQWRQVAIAREIPSGEQFGLPSINLRRMPEPWRYSPYGAESFLMPRAALQPFVDQRLVKELLRTDGERLDEVRASVIENGIKEPLLLIHDSTGRGCLKDGHHRWIVTEDLNMTHLPIRLKPSERIRGRHSAPLVAAFKSTT